MQFGHFICETLGFLQEILEGEILKFLNQPVHMNVLILIIKAFFFFLYFFSFFATQAVHGNF